jgi:hypothetical protein
MLKNPFRSLAAVTQPLGAVVALLFKVEISVQDRLDPSASIGYRTIGFKFLRIGVVDRKGLPIRSWNADPEFQYPRPFMYVAILLLSAVAQELSAMPAAGRQNRTGGDVGDIHVRQLRRER